MVTIRRTTSLILLIAMVLGPISTFAQQQTTNQQGGTWVTNPNGTTTLQQQQQLPGVTNTGTGFTTNPNTQGAQYISGNNTSGSEAQKQYNAIVSQYGECAISQIVARGLTNALNEVVDDVADTVSDVISVPTSNEPLEKEAEKNRKENQLLRNKEVAQGPTILGVPILPSWDAIGYCIVNTMIEYISESTIRWINSGFQGNPVFVDNFGQFFKDLANVETATFLNELSAPDFLCEPYKVSIQTGLIAAHADPYYQPEYRGRLGTGRVTGYGKCNFDQAQVRLSTYLSGSPQAARQGGWNSWYQLTQNPANNIYGSYLMAQRQLDRRVTGRQQVADTELKINEGFLSFKDEKNRITTPGKIIQSQIENRLNIPENRLVLAREFDEVVSALVDRLVKIALNEVLTAVNGD